MFSEHAQLMQRLSEPLPRIETAQLMLRELEWSDAAAIQTLAADRAIAETTLNIPHPYPEGAATEFIRKHIDNQSERTSAVFAIVLRENHALIGTAGLGVTPEHRRGEMGYWIGRPYWGRGLATEAAGAVIGYAFRTLILQRVWAQHFHTNPASGAVMRKLGMSHEGVLREHSVKWGQRVDFHCYGILRDEWWRKKNETT